MAETKQAKPKKSRSKKSSAGSSSQSKGGSSAKSKNGAKAKAGKAANSAKQGASSASSASSNGAAHGVEAVVQKAKLPLLAGGAAVAGVAGAVIASRSGNHGHKVLGVTVPKRPKVSMPKKKGIKSDAQKMASAVADAAKRADRFGQSVSKIASSVQKVGESADEAVKKG